MGSYSVFRPVSSLGVFLLLSLHLPIHLCLRCQWNANDEPDRNRPQFHSSTEQSVAVSDRFHLHPTKGLGDHSLHLAPHLREHRNRLSDSGIRAGTLFSDKQTEQPQTGNCLLFHSVLLHSARTMGAVRVGVGG